MGVKEEILSIFENTLDDTYYTELYGFNKNVPVYRKLTHLYAKIFFKVLDNLNLVYYTFAGTSIGYIRNKQNIPWVDDYDIMIFEEEIDKFKNIVIPKLTDLGFWCFKPNNKVNSGFHVLSKLGQKCFQCDIFFSKIDKDNIVKNVDNNWGLYNSKKLNINLIKPRKYLTIDNDLTIPFFNNMETDIRIEYGDIFNTIKFHINHDIKLTLNNTSFSDAYDSFNQIKTQIINNTKNLFKNHEYENNETLYNYNDFIKEFTDPNKVINVINFLKYIKKNKTKILNIMDENFLIFCPDVKLYFKDIHINFFMTNDIDPKHLFFLNYVDRIFCSKKQNMEYIEKNNELLILHKPEFEYTKVITFGTYDLFHIGHTNILKRAKNYGKLVVGISTDELNLKKGKTSINQLIKRKEDVEKSGYVDYIFEEESLELKNDYIKKYNCNLLIMGDDWKNAFDWCDCACLYLKRTPEISTTMLKTKM